jgi:hypothetical protein
MFAGKAGAYLQSEVQYALKIIHPVKYNKVERLSLSVVTCSLSIMFAGKGGYHSIILEPPNVKLGWN